MIGSKVIVRSNMSGVHFGTLVSINKNAVVLKESRRMWRFWCRKGCSISAAATHGLNWEKSKISAMVSEIMVFDVCEIVACTSFAADNIFLCPEYVKENPGE